WFARARGDKHSTRRGVPRPTYRTVSSKEFLDVLVTAVDVDDGARLLGFLLFRLFGLLLGGEVLPLAGIVEGRAAADAASLGEGEGGVDVGVERFGGDGAGVSAFGRVEGVAQGETDFALVLGELELLGVGGSEQEGDDLRARRAGIDGLAGGGGAAG